MTLEQTPQENAKEILSAQANGDNPDCLFNQLSRNDKFATYRELNKMQDSNDNIPDLRLYMGHEGTHIYPENKDAKEMFCWQAPKAKETAKPKREETADDQVWADFEKTKEKYGSGLEEREKERVENPERPARNIEDLADLALNGDEQSKLDLRYRLESLMNDRNPDYKKAVLDQMVEDGAYLSFNDVPHVKVANDASGKPESITFSRDLGLKTETVPLNKSVSEQVDEAQKNYMNALGSVTGGLGKFDANATMRAMEIQMGAEPENLRWFMIYRKNEGRPAVDRNN